MGPGRVDERSTDRYGDRVSDRGSHARRGAPQDGNGQYGQAPPRSRSAHPSESWSEDVAGYDRHDVEATFAEMEKELEKLRTERDETATGAEDLRYQIEVLRSKLHEQRRIAAQP